MSDYFYLGQPSVADRDMKQWEFFYKDCERARRNPYSNRSEYDCNEP